MENVLIGCHFNFSAFKIEMGSSKLRDMLVSTSNFICINEGCMHTLWNQNKALNRITKWIKIKVTQFPLEPASSQSNDVPNRPASL